MRIALFFAALLAFAAVGPAWAETLPSIQEVYATAKAGHLDQARAMVDKVLAVKPDSAKAHFVKAELCAAQSDIGCVRTELGTAKRIDAGLTFANPAAVSRLEGIARGGNSAQLAEPARRSGFPWGWLLIGFGVVALLMWIMSVAKRRAAQNVYPAYNGGVMNPQAPGYGGPFQPGYGAPMQGGGLGSSLGRGLATGAALGAGMVAGQALADSLLHPDRQAPTGIDPAGNVPDLGGADFGVSGDSWDGGGMDFGGGDSDW